MIDELVVRRLYNMGYESTRSQHQVGKQQADGYSSSRDERIEHVPRVRVDDV
jgi:hypothetical protein